MADDLQKQLYISEKRICDANANLKYGLIRFGDHLAEKQNYKEHKGLDAIHYYLMEKYHWLPSQARSINDDDLLFLFAEEMSGWTLPKDAVL